MNGVDDIPTLALKEELCRLHSRQQEEIVACIENWLGELRSVARPRQESSVATLKDLQPSAPRGKEPTVKVPFSKTKETNQSHSGTGFDESWSEVLPGMPSLQRSESDQLSIGSTSPPVDPATPASITQAKSEIGRDRAQSHQTDHTGTLSKNSKKKGKVKASNLLLSKAREEAAADLNRLQQFTTSTFYEYASGSLIVLNSIYIGIQTEVVAQQAQDRAKMGLPLVKDEFGWMIGGCLFCMIFIMELGLRWKADGVLDFFKNQDWAWNVFDVIIVTLSFVDLALQVAQAANPDSAHSHSMDGISVLRVLRVVRIIRVARVIRVMRFFRELRMMIFSILGSMKSLLWVFLVLVVTFYIFGMCFTNATLGLLDQSAEWLHPDNKDLVKNFGSLTGSMISLFMAMSGGNDWAVYYDNVSQLGQFYTLLFLLFITFSIFAVTNIVTGVFVETALSSNRQDRDIIVHEELELKQAYTVAMQSVFQEFDDDGTGCVSLEEFEAQIDDERVIAYFNALKLDVSDARTLFKLLDYDQSNEISIDEFVSGCFRLQGESRSLDMKIMQYEMKTLQEAFGEFMLHHNHGQRKMHDSVQGPESIELELSDNVVSKSLEVEDV